MLGKQIVVLSISIFILTGCATRDIKKLRRVDQGKEFRLNKDRALNIRYNDTAYSKALRDYGIALRKYFFTLGFHQQCINKEDKKCIDGILIGIDNIYDKTGKVFGVQDGVSDMVLGAFLKLSVFPMVNLDRPSTYGNINVRENLFSGGYSNSEKYTKNPQIISQLPLGVLKPTDYYVSGALLQYDKKEANKLNFDVKYLSAGRNFDIIDVALDLRVVDSSIGVIAMPEPKLKSAYISLQNRVVSTSINGEYFKLIHDDAFGMNISHEIGDPTQYAIREIVELAVLELVSKLTLFDWKKLGLKETVDKVHSNFVVKDR